MSEVEKNDLPEKEPVETETALSRALNEAFSKAEAKSEEPAKEESEATNEAEPKIEAEEVAESEEQTTEELREPDDKPSQEAKSEAEEEDSRKPHPRWSDEEKEIFSKLDKEAQDFVLRRQRETEGVTTQKLQEAAEIRKKYEPLDEVLRPYEERLRQTGQNPASVVAGTLRLQESFQRDPGGTIKQLAARSGIDLVDLALGADDSSSAQQSLTPEQIAERAEQAAFARFQQEQASQTRAMQEQRIAQELSQSEKYPYMDDVKEDVVRQAYAIRAANPNADPVQVLNEAYQAALRVNPQYYEKSLEEAKAQALKAEKERLQAEAEKAKRAGKPTTSRVSTSSKKVGDGKPTISDAVSAGLDKFYGTS